MSEPKLISPMLDSFDMGGPISDHDGVRCCPAMRKDTAEKYIVKIISVPASQTKLDALLLTGAYPNKEAALAYFKELADGIVEEKKVLDDLARLEGFVAYEDCQIVPMEDATGYDVYLLSPYRMTLERKIAKDPLTQLEAVNLGLDLCSALAICRRSGYMCVDIKPSNIALTGDKEYRISDIGFTSLRSMMYASLPDKYRSCYTAPEVEDAFSSLSSTMDIYAVGMILYQIYNDGVLPVGTDIAAPMFADEELAQIILKAIDRDPTLRWQDPVDMGQALVSYMQKNGVSDTPLTKEFFGAAEEVPVESNDEDTAEEQEDLVENESVMEETPMTEESDELSDECSDEEETLSEKPEPQENEEEISEEIVDVPVEDESTEDVEPETPDEETYDNLSFLNEDDEVEIDYDTIDADVSQMLEQIEELAEHQIPEPPVAPGPIEVKIPEPVVETFEEETESEEAAEDESVAVEEDEKVQEDTSEQLPPEETPYVAPKKRTGLVWCIVLILLIALGVGGYFFYQNYYLQSIDTFELLGSEDRLQVQVTSSISETELTVICADAHGNRIPAPVVGGVAAFTGLSPDTAYTVSIEVDGLHKLTGTTSKVYSTPIQTKIAQINIVTGSESGSVILSFVAEGPDSDQWNVIYSAEGEAERVTAFPSHMVTLTGLTVGKEYTFRLEPVADIYLSGEVSTTYVAKDLLCAENLQVIACADGILTAQWDVPADADTTWSARCYNAGGYDVTIETTENSVTFEGIDDAVGYTVEVIAEDMSVSQRVMIVGNSTTVSNFTVDNSNGKLLNLSWESNRDIPAEGWTLRYSVDGINAAQTINTTTNSAQAALLPDAEYVFTIHDSEGNPVLGGPFVHTQPSASSFEAYNVTASDMTLRLCKTPSSGTWSYKDLTDDDYMNTFSVGQKISAVFSLSGEAAADESDVISTFAIYDEEGSLITFSHHTQSWRSMWFENYCELDIPSVPAEQGTYNLIVYFNGQIAGSQKFAITA